MIIGFFEGAQPRIRARLVLPQIDERRAVNAGLLLDTGAAISIVHPRDVASYLGIELQPPIDFQQIAVFADIVHQTFEPYGEQRAVGLGGGASYYTVDARQRVLDEPAGSVSYRASMLIARPTAANIDYPSFLGMDFLTYFDVHLNHKSNVVTLDYVG